MNDVKIYFENETDTTIDAAILDNMKRVIEKTVAEEYDGRSFEVSVTIVTNDKIRALNAEYRGKDAPTDVLSFPMNELTPGAFDPDACEWDYETERTMLGDMVISMERCAEQAETYGHSFAHEVSYLTVHSVLHLLGYDHVDEGEDKRRMRAREKEIMRLLDV